MQILRKFLSVILSIAVINIFTAFDVYGEGKYSVYDAYSNKLIETFDYYSSALSFYNANIDEYENLVLMEDDNVLLMEYGIVEFKTNDECSLNVGYRSKIRNDTTSINGCYGKDALYLGRNGENVDFVYAGDVGTTSFDSIILHPFDSLKVRVSLYRNIDGELNHLIKTQLNSDYYAKVNTIDKAPAYIKEAVDYYSYDGHYFYDDFKLLSDDYRSGTFENAVNKDEPYYNYFQYLSFRSFSNYSAKKVDDFFKNTLKIMGRIEKYSDKVLDGANDVVNRSEYYDNIDPFFVYQSIFGTNALSTLSLSLHDSSSGKNLKAFLKQDLFLNNAYDNDEERNDGVYANIEKSIYSFDKYVLSNHNGNYHSTLYGGTFWGDKLSGYTLFNTLDAYYGETVSSNYYLLDKALGSKDLNAYCLGIVLDSNRLNFYSDEQLNNRLYRLYNVHNFSMIILGETDNAYKIQIDSSDDEEYRYDFMNNVAYIDKNDVDILLNEDKIHENELEYYSYDFNGGRFDKKESLVFASLKDVELPLIKPIKDGYEFVNYNQDNIAQFKQIKSIAVYAFPNKEVDINDYLDLSGAKIRVIYQNGGSTIKDITNDMISDFSNNELGEKEITISYCGVSTKVTIVVNDIKTTIKDDINSLVLKNIKSYKAGSYNLDEIEKIKEYLVETEYYFDFDELRTLDEILLNEYHDYINFIVFQNDLDISLSGLCLNIDTNIAKRKLFDGLIKNTYYVNIKQINRASYNKLKEIGEAYGFESIGAFRASFSFNMRKLDNSGELVYTIKPSSIDQNSIYSVYCLNDNGDIVKCKTYWSKDGISFIGNTQGSYMLFKKDSVNYYNFDSIDDSVAYQNNDPDTQQFVFTFISYLIVIIFGVINIIYHYVIENKLRQSALEFKKLLHMK